MTEALAQPWGELALYHRYAEQLANGLTPYRDFFPEYPPLALLFFRLPLYFSTEFYMIAYYGMVALAVLITILIIKQFKGSPWAFVASVLPLGGLFWDRFDIFPAMFSLLAVYLALESRYRPTRHPVALLRLSGAVLALGFATKIYPIIFLPLILIIIGWKPKKLLLYIWTFVFINIIIFGSVIITDGKFDKFVEFQGERGIHLESLRATPLLIKHLKGEIELETIYSHNTFELILK